MAGSFLDGLASKEMAKKNMGFGINRGFQEAAPAGNSLAGYLAANPATMAEIGAADQYMPQQDTSMPGVGYGLPQGQGFEGLSDRELQMIAAQRQVDAANAGRGGQGQGLAGQGGY